MDNVDWMEEFDAFENPSNNAARGAAGKSGGPKRRNASQIEELEQEMKLLHWHKLANEAALKAALIRTKKLKESSPSPQRRLRACFAPSVFFSIGGRARDAEEGMGGIW